MSNQSNDGFQGSQPFISDKQYQNLSLAELKNILEEEKESLKKNYKEQDAVWAYIWAWSYYRYDTLNMPYCS